MESAKRLQSPSPTAPLYQNSGADGGVSDLDLTGSSDGSGAVETLTQEELLNFPS